MKIKETFLEIFEPLMAALFTLLYHTFGLLAGISATMALPPTIIAQLLDIVSNWAGENMHRCVSR